MFDWMISHNFGALLMLCGLGLIGWTLSQIYEKVKKILKNR